MTYCFLDFETNKAGNFYLAGYSDGEDVTQVILNENLLGLAEHHNMRLMGPEDFANEFLIDCFNRELTLVAYSVAEKEILHSLIDKT